jgi:hypothetical protein
MESLLGLLLLFVFICALTAALYAECITRKRGEVALFHLENELESVEQELVGVELERDQLRNKLFYAEHDASELREFIRVRR